MLGQALLSSAASVPANPQGGREDVDRKPVGGTKMDKDILARTLERLRDGLVHKQVASGREFKGRPFNSKPELIHFKVSPPGVPGLRGQTPAPGGPGAPDRGGWLQVACGDEQVGGC